MLSRKEIGTQIPPSDSTARGGLEGNPPSVGNLFPALQPAGNELLASALGPGSPHSGGQSFLRAGNSDSASQGSNVVLLHERRAYTNRVVPATTLFVCEPDKETCTVLSMPNTVRKAVATPQVAPKKRGKKQAIPGQDGKTLGMRLELAMAYESGRRGREYRQVDLLADVNRLANAPDDKPVLTQQALSAIMLNKVTRSAYAHLMAAACHVNPLWLSEGIGHMTN
jgi:hypothetical protein